MCRTMPTLPGSYECPELMLTNPGGFWCSYHRTWHLQYQQASEPETVVRVGRGLALHPQVKRKQIKSARASDAPRSSKSSGTPLASKARTRSSITLNTALMVQQSCSKALHTPHARNLLPNPQPSTPSKFLENLIGLPRGCVPNLLLCFERHELWLSSRLQRPVATCTARDSATHESCATLKMQRLEPNQELGALFRANIYALAACICRAQGLGLYTSSGVR